MTEQSYCNTAILPSIFSLPSNRRQPKVEWLRAADGVKLGCRIWQGDEHAPVVIYLHGIEGHSQWFENTANTLNEKGITVYAPDRRASGMNDSLPGHLKSYVTLLSDLESQLQHIRQQHKKQKLFILANCWSAKMAVLLAQSNYRSTNQTTLPPLAGLVLIAPAIYTRVDFPLLTKLQIAIGFILGGSFSQKYWPVPLTTAMLTSNKKFIDFLENDNLRLTKATTSFFAQTFFLTKKAQKTAKFIKMPVLVLQGENDSIVNSKKLESWFQQLASTDKVIHTFPGADHSLDFDNCLFKEYTDVLAEWITTRGQFTV